MKTNCGVDFEKKLRHKSPWERFQYIRGTLVKQLKALGEDTRHLEISPIRKSLKWTTKILKGLQAGRLDRELFEQLAVVINEDILVLAIDYEGKMPKTTQTETAEQIDKKAKKILDKANKPSKKKLGVELVFDNHCVSCLSLDIEGNTVRIYENYEAPKTAKTVLIGRADIKVGGKNVNKTFPEKVKL